MPSYVRQVTNFRNRKKANGQWSSPAPFVGPIFVVVGYSALPFEYTPWLFLIFLLDPDTFNSSRLLQKAGAIIHR